LYFGKILTKSVMMELSSSLRNLLAEDWDAFLAAQAEPACVAVNRGKSTTEQLREKLQHWNVAFQPHPVSTDGFILDHDVLPLSHTLSFFRGEFRYQGISSQLPALALDPRPGETVLDLSAAPGSKSVQLSGLMRNQGRLLLNDSSMKRLEPLMANLSRAAVLNDVLINLPGQQIGRLLPEFFDRVLVDAPCSCLNTPDQRLLSGHWNSGYLQTISHIQEQLLISAIKAAKVDGVIVYSTCSLAPEENELVLARILENYPVVVEPLPNWPLASSRPGLSLYQERTLPASLQQGLRLYPFPEPVEGFFLIRLRKTAGLPIRPVSQALTWHPTFASDNLLIRPILLNLQKVWGLDPSWFENYRFWVNEHRLWLCSSDWQQVPLSHFVKTGLNLAVRKSHFWKLTTASAQWLGPRITRSLLELDSEQLIQLLAKGRFPYPGEALKYYVATRRNQAIGVVSQCRGEMKLRIPHPFRLVQDAEV